MCRNIPRLLILAGLAACALPRVKPPVQPAAGEVPKLRLVPLNDWPDFSDDMDPASLAKATAHSVSYLRGLENRLLQVGDATVGPQRLIDTVEELARTRAESKSPEELSSRLKAGFDLYRLSVATGPVDPVFSCYFQPTLPASLKREGQFQYPIYQRPADLVSVPLGAFNDKWKGESVVGRVDKNGTLVPYFSRRDIDVLKELEGKGLEIAWLTNKLDRLNMHVQGAGILVFPDGKELLAKYAANNGLPYTSVGLSLAGSGAVAREDLTYDRLRQYMAEHPEGEAWLLARNPRYIFFKLAELPEDKEPPGTIEQALTAGRSIAVDPAVIPLGIAAFIRLPLPQADKDGRLLGKSPTGRFVLSQDTGGAIKGTRIDLYTGHGPQAQNIARNVWDNGQLYVLIKKLP